GVTSVTWSYMQLLRALTGNTHLLGFCNYQEETPDPALLEVASLELEEAATSALFSSVKVLSGSPAAVVGCPCNDGACEACMPIRNVVEAMRQFDPPARRMAEPARLLIEHVYERVTIGKQRV